MTNKEKWQMAAVLILIPFGLGVAMVLAYLLIFAFMRLVGISWQ